MGKKKSYSSSRSRLPEGDEKSDPRIQDLPSTSGISIADLQTIISMLKGTDVASIRLTKGHDTLELTRFGAAKELLNLSAAHSMPTHSVIGGTSSANQPGASERIEQLRRNFEFSVPSRPLEYSTLETTSSGLTKTTPDEGKSELVDVKSPMVGIFYRRPSPDEEPFVEVGSKVQEGDSLAIIEAMKVMNQVKSPVAGIVEEILPENGAMVEFGEVIFRIRPL